MPVFKLHYFNARGRAEPARLCFAAAGVKYEDIRYTFEEWPQKKKDGLSPLGYLPMLEVDGKKLCESLTITRYIAKECGLCPSDSFEMAQCDMILDAMNDLYRKMFNYKFEKDEERKKTATDEFNNSQFPAFLTNMTGLLKSNNGGQGFYVGNKLSYADISMLNLWDWLSTDILEKFPEIKDNYRRVGEIAGIKEWIKNRPKTDM